MCSFNAASKRICFKYNYVGFHARFAVSDVRAKPIFSLLSFDAIDKLSQHRFFVSANSTRAMS